MTVAVSLTAAEQSDLEGVIIPVYKPVGISSFGVIHRLRRLTGIKRIGHCGTLDPFADGVLVVGIGRRATRRLGLFMKMEKEYIARVVTGIITDTDDLTGKVISSAECPPFDREQIEAVLQRFSGDIMQVPPRYSALKVDGQRMYKAARKGVEVERKPRPVTIKELELTGKESDGFIIRVVCSSGTYIRSLGYDIGQVLGCGAHLGALTRTRVGHYTLADALRLED